MPYFFRTEWGRPQILHLVYARVEYLGFLCCFTFKDVFAIVTLLYYFSKGIPSPASSAAASSSVFAVVVKTMFMPLIVSTLS